MEKSFAYANVYMLKMLLSSRFSLPVGLFTFLKYTFQGKPILTARSFDWLADRFSRYINFLLNLTIVYIDFKLFDAQNIHITYCEFYVSFVYIVLTKRYSAGIEAGQIQNMVMRFLRSHGKYVLLAR